MAMAVVISNSNDNSSCSTPYISAPSSPKHFTHDLYFSAPASPTRFTPFNWEEKSVNPHINTHESEEDFVFNFSGQLDKSSFSAADELFDGGKIRPLKPLGHGFSNESSNQNSLVSSPKSTISQGEKKKIICQPFSSPRNQRNDFDEIETATHINDETEQERIGRDRNQNSKKPGHRWTRSVSPFRVSELINFEEDPDPESEKDKQSNSSKPNSSRTIWPFRAYKKWKLKDFLLFRSASEGRGTEKDPLRKFSVFSKRSDDIRCSSFRSNDSIGSVSSSRRKTLVSPHELHYTLNRAASEELKKKTFLPYKQGLLGCLGFNPTAHGLAKGFNL